MKNAGCVLLCGRRSGRRETYTLYVNGAAAATAAGPPAAGGMPGQNAPAGQANGQTGGLPSFPLRIR